MLNKENIENIKNDCDSLELLITKFNAAIECRKSIRESFSTKKIEASKWIIIYLPAITIIYYSIGEILKIKDDATTPLYKLIFLNDILKHPNVLVRFDKYKKLESSGNIIELNALIKKYPKDKNRFELYKKNFSCHPNEIYNELLSAETWLHNFLNIHFGKFISLLNKLKVIKYIEKDRQWLEKNNYNVEKIKKAIEEKNIIFSNTKNLIKHYIGSRDFYCKERIDIFPFKYNSLNIDFYYSNDVCVSIFIKKDIIMNEFSELTKISINEFKKWYQKYENNRSAMAKFSLAYDALDQLIKLKYANLQLKNKVPNGYWLSFSELTEIGKEKIIELTKNDK